VMSAAFIAFTCFTPGSLQPWLSRVAPSPRWQDALRSLVESKPLPPSGTRPSELSFLFVDSGYMSDDATFSTIAEAAQTSLCPSSAPSGSALVCVIGNGVVGGNREVESEPALALLTGPMPPGSCAIPLVVNPGVDLRAAVAMFQASAHDGLGAPHGFLLMVDPWAETVETLSAIDTLFPTATVCGGLSAPSTETPSLALGKTVLPVGSSIIVGLAGRIALHSIVAQGCGPLGPSFTVTSSQGCVVHTLDGKNAIDQLQRVAESANEEERALMEASLLCGVAASQACDNDGQLSQEDFLIRIIVGATASGSIVLPDEVAEGQRFQFHARDRRSAQADLDSQLQRYRLERQFSSETTGVDPFAAILFSCNGRGSRMFGVANHDSECFQAALAGHRDKLDSGIPLGGFFGNGEMGSVGVTLASSRLQAHLHGFTSVFALLYALDDEEEGSSPPDPPN